MQALYQIDIAGSAISDVLKFDWLESDISSETKKFAENIIKGTVENLTLIDSYIEKTSKNWTPGPPGEKHER